MTLSLKKGIPIAILEGTNEKVYYNDKATDGDYSQADFERDLEYALPMIYHGRYGNNDELGAKDMQYIYDCILDREIPKRGGDLVLRCYRKIIDIMQDRAGKGIRLNKGNFQFLPYVHPKEMQTDSVVVAGPKGSGKSTVSASYANNYRAKFPHNPVYLFSAKPKDPVLDKIKGLHRFLITNDWLLNDDPEEGIVSDMPSVAELGNSLCIFDDICGIPNAQLRKRVINLQDRTMTMGRCDNIYVLTTVHILKSGHETKTSLQECTTLVIFPDLGSKLHARSYLKEHLGFEQHEIKKIMDVKSRWVAIRKCPRIIVSEHEIFLL